MRVTSLLDEGLFDREDGRRPSDPVRPFPPIAFLCAVIVWVGAAGMFYVSYDPQRSVPDGIVAGRYVFELLEDAHEGMYGMSAPARVSIEGRSYNVRVLYEGARYRAYERFEGYATFSSFSEERALRYASAGLVAQASVKGEPSYVEPGPFAPILALRAWASDMLGSAQTSGSALVRALVTGDRADLDHDGLYDDMKALGLAHMVAVSGSHLSVIASFAGALMRRFGVRVRVATVVLCVFYGTYAVFTGLSAPVIRAAVMSVFASCAVFAGRRSSALAALSACVCVLIALNPYNALSLSFFLSAASTFGVIVFAPLFTAWFSRAVPACFDAACEAFALTLAASLPIAPVTCVVFARISLAAPLANFVAAPLFTAFLASGLAVLVPCALMPALGSALLAIPVACADGFCAAAQACASAPLASIPATGSLPAACAATAAAAVLLWIWWPIPSARTVRRLFSATAAAIAVFILAFPRLAPDEVVMLDVGQGDAFLVRSQGRSLLVDTGNQEQRLMAALARHGASSVGSVAISHHDDDHCGCLELLAPNIAGDVIVAEETFSCGCDGCRSLLQAAGDTVGDAHVRGMAAGEAIEVGRFRCTAIWPYVFSEEGGNADSLCFLLEYDARDDGRFDATMLLTGDAEASEIRAMMDASHIDRVDVLKAGHHGSRAGVDDGFAQRVGADIVLISVGEHNRYGHPADEVLEEFGDAGARIYRSDECGDVSCRFSERGIAVVAPAS